MKVVVGSIVIMVGLFLSPEVAQAQKSIKLTERRSGRTLSLKENDRVRYTTVFNDEPTTGILTGITEKSFRVDSIHVDYSDLKTIGRKRKGSGFFAVAGGVLAGVLLLDLISPVDTTPCPNCQTTYEYDTGAMVMEGVAAGVLIALSINTQVRNSQRRLTDWKLEVVDGNSK